MNSKSAKRLTALSLFAALLALLTTQNSAWASPTFSSKCSALGLRTIIGGKSAVCAQKGLTLVWTTPTAKAPNVVGMGLPHAEDVLTAAKYAFDEHPLDGSLGIIVKENWLVCKEVAIGSKYVRLDVTKYGC